MHRPKLPVTPTLIVDELPLKEPYTFGEVFACLFQAGYTFCGWVNNTLVQIPKFEWKKTYISHSTLLYADHDSKQMYAEDVNY